MADEEPTKFCPKCQTTKPASEFGRAKWTNDGRNHRCKACVSEHRRAWVASNPDSARAILRKWEDNNHDRRVEISRAWKNRNRSRVNSERNAARIADPEKFRRQERERYARNHAVYAAKRARYVKAHPDKARHHRQLYYLRHKADFIAKYIRPYRARKRGATGRYTDADIQRIAKAQRFKCAYCPTSIRSERHVDHVIPLILGGTNYPSNIQLTCKSCNLSKGGSDPLEFSRRLGRLL